MKEASIIELFPVSKLNLRCVQRCVCVCVCVVNWKCVCVNLARLCGMQVERQRQGVGRGGARTGSTRAWLRITVASGEVEEEEEAEEVGGAQRSVVALAVSAWMRLVLQFLQRTCPSRG